MASLPEGGSVHHLAHADTGADRRHLLTSLHTGITAIVTGPFVSVVIGGVALLIQALFLAHGGLSTWGANVLSMGVVGSFVGFFTFRGLGLLRMNLVVAGFAAGLLADWAT